MKYLINIGLLITVFGLYHWFFHMGDDRIASISVTEQDPQSGVESVATGNTQIVKKQPSDEQLKIATLQQQVSLLEQDIKVLQSQIANVGIGGESLVAEANSGYNEGYQNSSSQQGNDTWQNDYHNSDYTEPSTRENNTTDRYQGDAHDDDSHDYHTLDPDTEAMIRERIAANIELAEQRLYNENVDYEWVSQVQAHFLEISNQFSVSKGLEFGEFLCRETLCRFEVLNADIFSDDWVAFFYALEGNPAWDLRLLEVSDIPDQGVPANFVYYYERFPEN